MVNNKSIRS
uniref:Mechanosensitive ion channel protein 2ic n=1 Tax=Rhizophora mucronata TaxID=61149 RepID=A0A2P2J4V6_RHIMU